MKKDNKQITITRKLFNLEVEQRTEDAYFNVSKLFQEWNEQNPDKVKRYDKWLELSQTKEFMVDIMKNDYDNILIISRMPSDGIQLNFSNLTNKDRNLIESFLIKRKKRGNKKMEFWIHPYLFIDCCQYISSDFKYQAIKMVADKLIQYRVDVCVRYFKWCEFLDKKLGAKEWDYFNTQKDFCKAVFGYYDKNKNQRNYATESELQRIIEYEDLFYNMYNLGLITNSKDIRTYLKELKEKNFPTKSIEIV